jgi:hypothetical protein
MSSNWYILLACGHWFAETRPEKYDIDPQQKRVCGVPGHFPQPYDAVYVSAEDHPWPDDTYTITRVDNTPESSLE